MMLKFATVSLVAMVIAGVAYADEMKVELTAVPKAVMDTAMKEVPAFKAMSANSDEDNGKKVFEVQGMNGDMKIEIDVMEDGTLDEVETEITMDKVPEVVTKAVMAAMPAFAPSKIEESKRPAGTFYEIEGADGAKKMDVTIKADGTEMKAEELKSGS